jgi:hypothetical protein
MKERGDIPAKDQGEITMETNVSHNSSSGNPI